ncbi:short chain dehydrogenase [Demequina sp. NBRC 110055]|uniref:short chain dehydrogenase n=1 Tax=Demequina sp. NBRC 110055 TaxID=1570344 RepID=UPI000A001E36|nr:short chain dehydrogenase [Demequina sp. NBRC 110055]
MKILLIGSGHVGSAAHAALAPHHDVIVASRSTSPSVDITDAASIEALFEAVGTVDAVVTTAGKVPFKPLLDLTAEDYAGGIAGKVLSQIDVVRIGLPYVTDGGSFTMTSGVLAREPIRTGAAASMANGALETWVMAAAPEMPRGVRLNAVSPSVLESSPQHHRAFAGFPPVSDEAVGHAYRRAVEGTQTGRTHGID